jgi:hypothetical protein
MGNKKACEDKEYVVEVEAKYKCKKCDRVSQKEKKLCKPKKMN